MYGDYPPVSPFLVRTYDFSRNAEGFYRELSSIKFIGGGQSDALVSEGLASVGELSWDSESDKFCILVCSKFSELPSLQPGDTINRTPIELVRMLREVCMRGFISRTCDSCLLMFVSLRVCVCLCMSVCVFVMHVCLRVCVCLCMAFVDICLLAFLSMHLCC